MQNGRNYLQSTYLIRNQHLKYVVNTKIQQRNRFKSSKGLEQTSLQRKGTNDQSAHERGAQSLIVAVGCLVAKSSCLTLLPPDRLQPARLLCPWDFPGKYPGVGCHFLLHPNYWRNANQNHHEIPVCTPLFIAALFTTAKKLKQPKCPLVIARINKKWYILHTMEYYSVAAT